MLQKRVVGLIMVVLLAVPVATLAVPKQRAKRAKPHEAPKFVELQEKAFVKAMNENNAEKVAALFGKRARAFTTDVMEVKGRDAIRDAYRRFFEANTVKDFRFDDRSWQLVKYIGAGWGRWTATVTPKSGGTPVEMTGRYSDMARVSKKGKTHFLMMHLSVPLPPAGAPAPAAEPAAAPAAPAP